MTDSSPVIALESELVASILDSPGQIAAVAPLLAAEDFAGRTQGIVYAAIRAVHERGELPTFATVLDELRKNGKLPEICIGADHGADALQQLKISALGRAVAGAPAARRLLQAHSDLRERRARERAAARLVESSEDHETIVSDMRREIVLAGEPTGARAPWASRVIVPAAGYYTSPPPRREWLLRDLRTGAGMLPRGVVGLVPGAGGVGKSMAFAQAGIAIPTQTPFLGTFDVVAPGRVLLVFGEEDADEIQRRLHHARAAVDAPIPEQGSIVALPLAGMSCSLIERDERGNPAETAFLRWLRDYARTIQDLRLVVLDPLARFAGIDAEKDNALATRAIEAIETIAVATGATVLVGHHTSQASRSSSASSLSPDARATVARGVTGLTDGARWVAALASERVDGVADADRLGELVSFSSGKSNYSRHWAPVHLRRDTAHGGALVPLDAADRMMVEDARAAAPARRASAREHKAMARSSDEDAAVPEVVSTHPGLDTRALRAALALHLGGCQAAKADKAITRALESGAIRREGARNTGYRYFVS